MTHVSSQVQIHLDRRLSDAVVALVTINNARKLNTLNSQLMREMIASFTDLASNPDLRAVVLTGAGDRAFIGGANIDEMITFDVASARAYITLIHECCEAIRSLPVPVIARINGYTIGAGLEIAASCDLRVASRNATFAMPEVKLGLPSVIEAALLPSLIGWGQARRVLLLGEPFSAAEAAQWGLVERVVEADELDAAVESWIGALLETEPRAVRMQKALMRTWEDLPLRGAIKAGIDCFAEAWEVDNPRVAVRKFVDSERARKAVRRAP